jgi:hypothetical protein
MASRLHHAIAPVKIDKVNRKLHAESVDGFAGHDPQAFAIRKPGATQQAFSSPLAAIRNFNAVGDFSLTSQIGDTKSHLRSTAPFRQDAA